MISCSGSPVRFVKAVPQRSARGGRYAGEAARRLPRLPGRARRARRPARASPVSGRCLARGVSAPLKGLQGLGEAGGIGESVSRGRRQRFRHRLAQCARQLTACDPSVVPAAAGLADSRSAVHAAPRPANRCRCAGRPVRRAAAPGWHSPASARGPRRREGGPVLPLQQSRHAEIQQAHFALFRDEDVRRLQVAMEDLASCA